ncbi:GNAT family N-acetyltransferase [Acinetobacter haemolyticus]|uniref:GNAT family N-acetyltransferase n=1 Tax=Acinetobacter haemolyticus TaxID=29430 RepID=A0AAJ3D8K2_ACIHA|nr:GNAT family N-acetyltransferase [Acinetobacter haemolyticus]NAR19602.1 GNAT family N-acetyltransferase [Acinetobacter haemolyticus]NAR30860.1 GNAT family N-acetyltransferase [Acinetobacter haemolyticus]NAR37554.1 GNAT family N-acetyltransferase [Acinetobacter haemolyticus]NAR46884.1 GNAT family N-acetyltransferase [Acinetobacter haemolyticus]NAR62205.1 GNAT family N-acetyltransferase [Acinetobacter haemolyticus]
MLNIVLRELHTSEIDLIWQQISRRELITQMYVQQRQDLGLIDCFYDVENWDAYHLENDPPLLKQICQQDGLCIGAFNSDHQLVGVQVVSNRMIVDYPDAKLLQYFYVDADHQGQGIGAQLMYSAIVSAKRLGAKQLYISATPSKRTVDFYLRHGAKLLTQPDHHLWELEPEDIHLIYLI